MTEKILIVDDDVETVRLISLVLKKQGYEIITATNGIDGLNQALKIHPDLIILDIMMPDVDGYQVTHQLRENHATTNTPILMFSAKSQVDDRVAGYESGIDDYISKPVHPSELIARVKTLISRTKSLGMDSIKKGYMIAVLAPKGGMGASSMALNLGILINQLSQKTIIAAELHPGHGTWASELGIENANGYVNLLRRKPTDITLSSISKELFQSSFGVKLLLSSNHLDDVSLINAGDQIETIVRQLPFIASLVFLDIGANYLPNFDQLAAECQEAILLTEPYPNSIEQTRMLMADLSEKGFGRTKILTIANVNRIRADMQVPFVKVQEMLGKDIFNFPAAPEIAYQASMNAKPLVMMQPESLLVQQYRQLASTLLQRISLKSE
jgi:DNA-binding response OmpR family regulator